MLKTFDVRWAGLAWIHRTARLDGPDVLIRCVYDADGTG